MVYIYNDRKINYTDSGAGFPVVLIHGYLETSQIWKGFEEKLAQSFRVITPDLPGHGQSDMLGSVHSMELMATVIRDLLASIGIRKVFLAGHSLGGYVTLAFLDLFPEMLSGYCLFHSQPFADNPQTVRKREREIALAEEGRKEEFIRGNVSRMFAETDREAISEKLQRSMEIASEISPGGIIAVLKGMMERPSRLQVLEEGRAPLLWILGAKDNYISAVDIVKMVDLPENSRVVILENSGHMGFTEEEALSLKILSGFIDDLKH